MSCIVSINKEYTIIVTSECTCFISKYCTRIFLKYYAMLVFRDIYWPLSLLEISALVHAQNIIMCKKVTSIVKISKEGLNTQKNINKSWSDHEQLETTDHKIRSRLQNLGCMQNFQENFPQRQQVYKWSIFGPFNSQLKGKKIIATLTASVLGVLKGKTTSFCRASMDLFLHSNLHVVYLSLTYQRMHYF